MKRKKMHLQYEADAYELRLYELTGKINGEAVCSACGNTLEPGTKFCGVCGNAI